MTDQPPTLDPLPPAAAAALTRNLSSTKLNAKAPEFVPRATTPPPPMILAPPPPPPPPPQMIPVFPPPPHHHVLHHVPPPHLLHHIHHRPQHVPHYNNNNNNNNHFHHHGGVGNGLRYQQKSQSQNNNNNSEVEERERRAAEGGSSATTGQQDKEKERKEKEMQGSNNSNGATTTVTLRNGLSEDQATKLIKQVEYYFSDVNLATTDHLIRCISKDPEGFVPLSVVASFKKIKALISGIPQLSAVLRNSTKLVVSEDGKKVKRLHPLSGTDMDELQARIIVAENLPDDHCHQNLMKIFSAVGSVKSIRTCQPQPSNNGPSSASRASKSDNVLYSNKLHAFVEYESVELAENAVVELNDEDDWRNGLRVRLLHKRGSKSTQARVKKAGDGEATSEEQDVSTSEQNRNEKQSEDLSAHSDNQPHEHGEDQNVEKEGRQKKNRKAHVKGRGRGQHHHQNNRGNHIGAQPHNNVSNEQPVVIKQQPPGPRMPDGTRGFSMGRGRPLTVNAA